MGQNPRGGLGSLSLMKEADQTLIRLLSDGECRSGSELGKLLGISRAAVWKRIQRLEQFGLALESIKGKGYRLSQPLHLLELDRITESLADRARLQYSWVTESTNADALALPGPVSVPHLFISECQLAGRGRRGRQWQSPFAANIYLSLRYSAAGGFSTLGGLSLVVGAVVARALVALDPSLPVTIKWPNDIVINGSKVGGILIELAGEMDGQVDVVIGIGMNGAMTAAQAADIDQRWTGLADEMQGNYDRTDIASVVLDALLDALPLFSERGFSAFSALYAQFDGVMGRQVRVISGDSELLGTACGVTDEGALKVDDGIQVRELFGGEVSLRLQ